MKNTTENTTHILTSNIDVASSGINYRTVSIGTDIRSYGLESQLVAHFYGNGDVAAIVTRFRDGKKPAKMRFTEEELDALIAAYTAYKADVQAAAEAEQKRIDAINAEITKLIEEHPEVTVDNGVYNYIVSVPQFDITEHARGLEEKLEAIKKVVKLADEAAQLVLSAHKLVKRYPEIAIREEKNSNGFGDTLRWTISIPGSGAGWYCGNPKALDTRVRQAVALLKKKAERTKQAQTDLVATIANGALAQAAEQDFVDAIADVCANVRKKVDAEQAALAPGNTDELF